MSIKESIKIYCSRENIFLLYLAILTIAIFVYYVLYAVDFFSGLANFMILLLSILVTGSELVRIKLSGKKNTILMSSTYKYIFDREGSNIDDLLGILIARTWERPNINQLDKFFETMVDICQNRAYEDKRRVAEALPALFEIDLDKTKKIFEILRFDWDNRWKSDNRRRAIESLSYLIDKDYNFLKEILQLDKYDEIFSIFAMVEIINALKKKKKKGAEKLYLDLIADMRTLNHSNDAVFATSTLWNLLNELEKGLCYESIDIFKKYLNHSNLYVQIVAARNLNYLFNIRTTENVLELMDMILINTKHKYVRRPLAREISIDFLISLLEKITYKSQSRNLLCRIFDDDDDIIRLTAFDKIDKILEVDEELGREILGNFIEREKDNQTLVERAKNVSRRYCKVATVSKKKS